jgi:hypothetical protein
MLDPYVLMALDAQYRQSLMRQAQLDRLAAEGSRRAHSTDSGNWSVLKRRDMWGILFRRAVSLRPRADARRYRPTSYGYWRIEQNRPR